MLELKKELEPAEILNEAITKGITSFYVAYSGGKDSGIILDIIAKEFSQYFKGVIFVDTGIATKATIKFVEDYCKERNYRLYHLYANDIKRQKDTHVGKIGEPFSFENLVLTYGFPKQALHTITMRWIKYYSMRNFISQRIKAGEKPALISGMRQNESQRRKKSKYLEYIYQDGKMCFVSPIFFKSNNWVMKYFIENNIKRSPVYETLHISGDCLCGCFAKKDELKLLEMFHPDVFKEIKRLEKLIVEKGTLYAKKNKTWGGCNQTTNNIESQTNMDQFVCNECFFDREYKEVDTQRFEEEMKEIDKKLEMV